MKNKIKFLTNKRKYQYRKFFDSIEMNDDNLGYCKSHNFIFDKEIEDNKLYNGLPCIHTDSRYKISNFDEIYFNKRKVVSLKSAIRKCNSIRNVPNDLTFKFKHRFYIPQLNDEIGVEYKPKQAKTFNPDYEVDIPEFYNNFKTDIKGKTLTDLLRSSGFIVKVFNYNIDKLLGEFETGELAFAFGCGKRIGYSSNNDTFNGYACGRNNILWDYGTEFNKWSQCYEIDKSLSNEQILELLIYN